LNDAKGELSGHLDRHDSLGSGKIGLDTFKFIMHDARFDHLPMILETPDDTRWTEEIRLLYSI